MTQTEFAQHATELYQEIDHTIILLAHGTQTSPPWNLHQITYLLDSARTRAKLIAQASHAAASTNCNGLTLAHPPQQKEAQQ